MVSSAWSQGSPLVAPGPLCSDLVLSQHAASHACRLLTFVLQEADTKMTEEAGKKRVPLDLFKSMLDLPFSEDASVDA